MKGKSGDADGKKNMLYEGIATTYMLAIWLLKSANHGRAASWKVFLRKCGTTFLLVFSTWPVSFNQLPLNCISTTYDSVSYQMVILCKIYLKVIVLVLPWSFVVIIYIWYLNLTNWKFEGIAEAKKAIQMDKKNPNAHKW